MMDKHWLTQTLTGLYCLLHDGQALTHINSYWIVLPSTWWTSIDSHKLSLDCTTFYMMDKHWLTQSLTGLYYLLHDGQALTHINSHWIVLPSTLMDKHWLTQTLNGFYYLLHWFFTAFFCLTCVLYLILVIKVQFNNNTLVCSRSNISFKHSLVVVHLYTIT